MALEVGELVSYLRMDDSDFQRKLSKGGTDLQRFGQGAARALQPIATGFTAGTVALGTMAGALLAQGAAYNTLQQTSRAALTTILGGAEAANAQMDKLDDFARNSPFAKQVFIKAQQQMLAFGIETEKVIPYLGAIQDGVAAMGGSNQEISEIAFIMSQISAAGKITGEDLMQLGQRGVNAAKLIGDQMGLTEVEVRESITSGTLDAGEALDSLAAGMQETYDGAAANVKETWSGATDRVKAAIRDIGSALAAPLIDPNGGGKALDWANAFADLLRAVEGQAGPLIEVLLPKLLPLADGITARLEDAAAAVEGLDMDQLIAQLGGIGEYAAPLAAVAAALFAMGTQAAPIQALGLSLNPVAAALVAIIAASPDARGAVMELLGSFSELRDEAGDLLLAVGDLGNVLIDGLVQILTAVTVNAGEAGGAIDLLELGMGGLTSAIQLVTGVAEPLLGFLAGLIEASSGAEGPILAVVAAMVAMRAVDVGGVITKLTGALSDGRQTWQASQATLEGLGREAGLMNTSMMTARAGVTRLGGAIKGLAVANAPMLAIAGLAAVIGAFVQEAAKADAMADQLAGTFDELTGAATAETDRMILTQLNEQLTAGDWDELAKIGYSYSDVVNAIKEGGPAYDQLWKDIEATRIAQHGWSQESQNTQNAMSKTADALRDVGPAYQLAAEQQAEMAKGSHDLAEGQQIIGREAGDTSQALATFEDALATLSDEASTAEQRLDALRDIMDLMAGGVPTVAEATIDHADALRDATKAAEGFELSQEQLNSILTDDGALNLQSEAVSKLRGEMDGLVDTAGKQADALIQQGDVEGAIKVYEDLDQQLRDLAETAGVENPKAVDALIESLALLPPEVIVDLQANGTEAAEENILLVQQHLAELPDTVTSYINGDTAGITSAVDETDLRMAYVAALSADPMIGADDQENLRIVAAATARLEEIDGMEPTPELRAEKSALERVVGEAKIDLNSIPDKEAEVIAEVFGFGSVEDLRRAIGRISSKTVTVRTNFVTSGSRPSSSRPGTRTATIDADGSVHLPKGKRFADGGIEHHVAQIAPAGAWRIWAEEETGGEAYIPLAEHKRARSLAIMHDVAARFGHVMVPVNAQPYANGGVTTPPQRASGGGSQYTYSPTIQGPDAHVVAGLARADFEHWVATESTGYRGA